MHDRAGAMRASVGVIVPAAGAGRRMEAKTPKPFLALGGQPLVAHALRALQESPLVRWIVLVVQPQNRHMAEQLLARCRITKALPPCDGGRSRAESVAKGFAALPPEAAWVLVHDAARPCLDRRLIKRSVDAAKRHGAVACGLPATLTVKAADETCDVRLTLDRSHLWFVQTPQVFRRDWFAEALARAGHRLDQFPDDVAILEAAGFPVRMVPGNPLNVKVTTRDDLVLAEAILASRDGRGEVDIHKAKGKTTRAHP